MSSRRGGADTDSGAAGSRRCTTSPSSSPRAVRPSSAMVRSAVARVAHLAGLRGDHHGGDLVADHVVQLAGQHGALLEPGRLARSTAASTGQLGVAQLRDLIRMATAPAEQHRDEGAAAASWGKTSSDATEPNVPAAQPIHGGPAGLGDRGRGTPARPPPAPGRRVPGGPPPRCRPRRRRPAGATAGSAGPRPADTGMTARASQIVDCGSPSVEHGDDVRATASTDAAYASRRCRRGSARPRMNVRMPPVWATREGGVAGAGRSRYRGTGGRDRTAPRTVPARAPRRRRCRHDHSPGGPAADPGRTVPDGAQRDHRGPHRPRRRGGSGRRRGGRSATARRGVRRLLGRRHRRRVGRAAAGSGDPGRRGPRHRQRSGVHGRAVRRPGRPPAVRGAGRGGVPAVLHGARHHAVPVVPVLADPRSQRLPRRRPPGLAAELVHPRQGGQHRRCRGRPRDRRGRRSRSGWRSSCWS